MFCDKCGWTKYNKNGLENKKHTIKSCRDNLVKRVKSLNKSLRELCKRWKDMMNNL